MYVLGKMLTPCLTWQLEFWKKLLLLEMNGLKAWSLMRAWTAFPSCFHPRNPPPQKGIMSLWQTVFVHKYCYRSWNLRINYLTQLSAFQQTLWKLREVTPDPASDSDKPDKLLFKPGTEVLIKMLESGGQSLEPLWESPYQISLTSYMGLLLLTPKVLSLLFDHKTMPSCPELIPIPNSTKNLIAGSAEHSPSSSIEGFPWWVSPLQEEDFLQPCKSYDI